MPKSTIEQAEEHCKGIGARLPGKEDFVRLKEFLGGESEIGYIPQILPNLSGNRFWSSSVPHSSTYFAFDFHGSDGHIGYYYRYYDYRSVRCVIGSAW